MVSGLVATAARMRSTRRQLPITGFAHKAAVVGDDGVSPLLVLAARHMPTEGRRAAALDRTHDLHLVEADVPGIGATPRRPMAAEYLRDLQLWAGHDRRSLGRRRFHPAFLGLLARPRQQVERALDAGDHAGGDTGVARRRVQLVVTEKRLDLTNIDPVLEQVGREAVSLMPSSA